MARIALVFLLLVACPSTLEAQSGGATAYFAGAIELVLIDEWQTAASLRIGSDEFDVLPRDRLASRAGDGFYHLGDLTLRFRTRGSGWTEFSSARSRTPAGRLPAEPPILAASEIRGPLPLRIRRTWVHRNEALELAFEIENVGADSVEIGALGLPMIFNNMLDGRSLEEAHSVASFQDPYLGGPAGYLQVSRLSGTGPTLIVAALEDGSFEAWRPLLDDSTSRGITFEGFYEWMMHSRAYADSDWAEAEPWNPPTSAWMAPGDRRRYGVRFLVAPGVRQIESTLVRHGYPVAVGIPGYVLPRDHPGRLFLRAPASVQRVQVEPEAALRVEVFPYRPGEWQELRLQAGAWGRARLTIHYSDGQRQIVHYKITDPLPEVVDSLGAFLSRAHWLDDPDDPFARSPGFVTYDYAGGSKVLEDRRAWIAGLGDEGGSGSWLAMAMKQLLRPRRAELIQLERFVDETLWGGLQVDSGPMRHGVRKSLFYWEPSEMPPGTYSDSVGYGGWASWSRAHAETVGRSFNYVHVAALYWVMYRIARNDPGLVSNRPWSWYLRQAQETARAMVRLAPEYARFGQMGGTVFLLLLEDLKREGWGAEAQDLEADMRARAEEWAALEYPFGSEMPWDSTGQEEVYAWTRYFGFDERARVTLSAILGYMPTVPHWGYNGSARRYWDFWYAGHPATSRLERQLHHYGSGLNALPVLQEYRDRPDDLYLLRVGYGGHMGAISNVTREGFGPAAFHAFPSTLANDGYSGDFGSGFLGHALAAGAYVVRDPDLGWLGFGADVRADSGFVEIRPLDAARRRLFVAPLGQYVELETGRMERARLDLAAGGLRITLAEGGARIRVEASPGFAPLRPGAPARMERGAYVIEAGHGTDVELSQRP